MKSDCRFSLRRYLIESVSHIAVTPSPHEQTERLDGVILAGTELPLLFGSPIVAGLPALDTTELHVAGIIERLRAAAIAKRSRSEAVSG